MKKLLSLFIALLPVWAATAQTPQKFSYQAVVRDGSSNLVTSTPVGMQISILQGSSTGTVVYVETQTPSSNVNGLVSIEIGFGTVVSGTFSTIDWSNGTYFIKTETDPTGGTNYTITGTSQLLSVPYALHAKTAEMVTSNVNTYSIGDFAQGGIVFWVDETGQHGLVAAKEDQSTGVRWYAGTFGRTQAKGNGIFSGKANTSIIIAAQVAIGDDNATYAARICHELQVTEGDITYSDWYLPSAIELNLMFQNRVTINAVAGANGSSSFFSNSGYWSSTEFASNGAIAQAFIDGSSGGLLKSVSSLVRAVRSF